MAASQGESFADSLSPGQLASLRRMLLKPDSPAVPSLPNLNPREEESPPIPPATFDADKSVSNAYETQSPEHPVEKHRIEPESGVGRAKVPRRRVRQKNDAVPPLKTASTAPELLRGPQEELEGLEGTRQTHIGGDRMRHTFEGFHGGGAEWDNGGDDEAGDTQPMDSQIYREFTTSKVWNDDTQSKLEAAMPGWNAEADTTHHSGLVDLVGNWDAEFESQGPTSSFDGSVVDELSSQTQSRTQQHRMSPPLPRAAMVGMPETPAAMAGSKRNHRGELISSVSRTPGSALPSFFGAGAGGPTMSLTQAFNQTQALTSPAIGELKSDPVFQRPSPDFAHHRSTSPHQLPNSSPTKWTRSAAGATSPQTSRALLLEPRDTYMSMKESQELRAALERKTEEELKQFDSDNDSDFDDEFTIQERRAARRRLEAQLKERNMRQLAELTAPRKSTADGMGGVGKTHAMSTPRTSRKKMTNRPTRGSRDDRETVDLLGDAEEDIPDSMDELSPDHPSSQRATRRMSPPAQSIEVPMTSSKSAPSMQPTRAAGATRTSGNQASASDLRRSLRSSQRSQVAEDEQHASNVSHTIAVADSQPDNGDDSVVMIQSQRLADPSSLSSLIRVAQSQPSPSNTQVRGRQRRGKGYAASNMKAVINSSQSIVKVEDEEGVPSSPPVASGQMSRGDLLERVPADENHSNLAGRGTSVIPDSDLHDNAIENTDVAEAAREGQPTSGTRTSGNASGNTTSAGNTNTAPFDTAQTHMSSSSRLKRLSQRSTESRRTPSQTPRLADLVMQPSPEQRSLGVDIDELNLVTEDDEQFRRVMYSGSSPVHPSRRRKKVMTYAARPARVHVEVEDRDDESSGLSDVPNDIDGVDAGAVNKEDSQVQTKDRRQNKLSKAEKSQNKTSPKKAAIKSTENKKSLGTEVKLVKNAAEAADDGGEHESKAPNEVTPSESTVSRSEAIAPNRIFALFKGRKMAYYPATYISSHRSKCRVRFDEGTEDKELEPFHIFDFALKVGDTVKVDETSMRHQYIVVGFEDKVSTADIVAGTYEETEIDQHGFRTVLVQPKSAAVNKGSASTSSKMRQSVDMALIYFNTSMVSNFKGRLFNPSSPNITHPTNSRLQTPSASTSFIETPPSRSRRNTAQPRVSTSNLTSMTEKNTDQIFSNMVFALTSAEDKQRAEITALIQQLGGAVLDSFEALFTISESGLDAKSPSSPTSPTTPHEAPTSSPLILAPAHQTATFAALIADRHSRTPKYMQALALNLPCLSPRWVRDCAAARHVLPWPRYLLPAGDSAFLSGATRSRTLASYSAPHSRLADTLAARALPLQGRGILLVGMAGSKKAAQSREDKMRLYVFLSYALGAARVRRVRDAREAGRAVAREIEGEGEEWDWAYVNGKAAAVRETARTVLGEAWEGGGGEGNGGGKGKGVKGRRKSERDDGGGDDGGLMDDAAMFAGDVGGRKFRVAGDEYVVQSLILGEFLG